MVVRRMCLPLLQYHPLRTASTSSIISCMHASFGHCIQHLKAKIMRRSSMDPEDVPIQDEERSVKESEIPTKEKCGEARRIVNKVHKEMSFAVVAACLISVLMDPFFFYIGLVRNNKKCFRTETRLQNLALISRSVADILFLMDMIFHINKARKLVASDSKQAAAKAGGGGGGKSKTFKYLGHVKAIANKLSLDSKVFITVDFFAILPIPQLLVVSFLTRARQFGFSGNRTSLNVLLLLQYLPRTYVLLRLSNNLRNNSSPVWLISVFYFATCILASHVIGAFWYFTAIQRQLTCWYQASCSRLDGECRNIYCDDDHRGYSIGTLTMINKICSLDDGAPFSFGMFHDALKSGYMERTISGGKLSYFMWRGLKNLSTNGTDLQTSTYLWENCFAILLAILGMVLFAYLIGHMQQCLQSATEKQEVSDKVRKKERDLQEWIERNFPKEVEEIWPDIKQKLEKDNDANMEILYSLPKNLRNRLCKKMLKKVLEREQFEKMKLDENHEDEAWFESNIYTYLKPVMYTQKEFIFRVGEPLDSMLYIVDGTVIIYTTGNSSDSPSMIHEVLMSDGVYGDEQLMRWDASRSTDSLEYSLKNLPTSTKNVRCHTKVEGFVLTAKDLKTLLHELEIKYHLKEKSRSHIGGTS